MDLSRFSFSSIQTSQLSVTCIYLLIAVSCVVGEVANVRLYTVQGLSRQRPAIYYDELRHLSKKIQETLCTGQSALFVAALATAARCSFLLWQKKPQNKFCHSTFHAKNLRQDFSVFWKTQISLRFSRGRSSIFVDYSQYTFQTLRFPACCRLPERGSLCGARWPRICSKCLCHTHCIVPESFLNHPNSFRRGMLNFIQIFCSIYNGGILFRQTPYSVTYI